MGNGLAAIFVLYLVTMGSGLAVIFVLYLVITWAMV
jgi:hypothetical protein